MISQKTVEEIKSRVDIVEVVSDFVQLKKSGSSYKALSPFTQEKTPSFFVSPAKEIYKCFSTGKGGDAISFIMEVDGLSYLEALKYLAKKYNVEIEEEEQTDEDQARFNERESLFIILNFAKDYFADLLWQNDEGRSIGLSYFHERGFSDETIKAFELGYSLDQWDGLIKAAVAKGYNEELLEKTGLKIVKENKSYDRFRGRVIFPIHNVTGKVIAFGARILKKQENQPKYINSPETALYEKSKILYGISQAKQSIRLEDNCFLVEGYTDVISLYQRGIKNVVASSGTSLTEDQIRLIKRFTQNVTVLFDGDQAGIKASLRGIDMILEGDLNVKAVIFPEGEDPDSYSRKLSPSAFANYLETEASDFITFKAKLLARDSANDPIRRAETIREIVSSIAKVPDAIKRSVYIKECSRLLGIEESVLITEQNKILVREHKNQNKQKPQEEDSANLASDQEPEKALPTIEETLKSQERECIRMLLNYADQITKDEDEEDEAFISYFMNELDDITFETPVYSEIYDIFRTHLDQEEILTADFFIQQGPHHLKQEVVDLIAQRYEPSENWQKFGIYIPRETDDLRLTGMNNILHFKLKLVKKMIEQNNKEMKEASEDVDIEILQKKAIALNNIKKKIADQLGIVILG